MLTPSGFAQANTASIPLFGGTNKGHQLAPVASSPKLAEAQKEANHKLTPTVEKETEANNPRCITGRVTNSVLENTWRR